MTTTAVAIGTAAPAPVQIPVVESAPDLLGAAAEAAIQDIAREFAGSNLDDEEAALAPAADPAASAAAPAPVEAAAPAPVAPPAEDPGVARGLDRLVAREVEVRTQEAAVQAARAEVLAAQAEVQALRAAARDISALRAQAAVDPEAALTALGLDPNSVVQLMIGRKLGDKAPPELRAAIREQALAKRMADLEAREAAAAQATAAAQFFDGVSSNARAYVTSGLGENAPTLSAMAKADPATAHAWILEEIRSDAAARAAREPNGQVISNAEAARRVEARLAPVAAALRGGSVAPAAAPASTTPTPTTAQVAPPSPARPTVNAPMFPWQRRDATLDDGLREALAEFRRVESATR